MEKEFNITESPAWKAWEKKMDNYEFNTNVLDDGYNVPPSIEECYKSWKKANK